MTVLWWASHLETGEVLIVCKCFTLGHIIYVKNEHRRTYNDITPGPFHPNFILIVKGGRHRKTGGDADDPWSKKSPYDTEEDQTQMYALHY